MPNVKLLREVMDLINEIENLQVEVDGKNRYWNQAIWRHFDDDFVLGYDENNVQIVDYSTDRCNTGMCFAGWVIELSKDNPDVDVRWKFSLNDYIKAVKAGDRMVDVIQEELTKVIFNRKTLSAATVAQEILDIDGRDADYLFSGSNGIATLNRFVDNLCEGRTILTDGTSTTTTVTETFVVTTTYTGETT